MRIKESILIIFIFLFALFLRLVYPQVPPSLNWDEVSHAVNARFLLQSGMDEWGQSFPLVFRAFGDYKLPGYIYILAGFFAIFGESQMVVRLPSAFFGSLMVVFVYLITKKAQKQFHSVPQAKILPFLTSVLFAVSPWTLFASRAAFEANVATSFFVIGVYFFLRKDSFSKNIWILSWLISSFTYNSFRVIVPLLLCVYIFSQFKHVWKKNIKISKSVFLALIVVLLNFSLFLTSQGNARLANISVIDQGLISRVEQYRNSYQLPELLEKLVFNRYIFASQVVTSSYLSAFDPRFLFFEGGDQRQFSVPGYGVLPISLIIPMIVGLLYLFRNIKHSWVRVLLLFLVIAPIPASVTRDAPHVLRLLPMSIFWIMACSFGLIMIFNKVKPLFFVIALFFALNISDYLNHYLTVYPEKFSSSWQYGSKQMAEFVTQMQSDYDKVLITKEYGEPHIFILWYGKYSSREYLSDTDLVRFNQSGWWWTDSFSNYVFLNSWQIPSDGSLFVSESGVTVDCNLQKCLLLRSPGEVMPGWRKIEVIVDQSGKTIYEAYENIKS